MPADFDAYAMLAFMVKWVQKWAALSTPTEQQLQIKKLLKYRDYLEPFHGKAYRLASPRSFDWTRKKPVGAVVYESTVTGFDLAAMCKHMASQYPEIPVLAMLAKSGAVVALKTEGTQKLAAPKVSAPGYDTLIKHDADPAKLTEVDLARLYSRGIKNRDAGLKFVNLAWEVFNRLRFHGVLPPPRTISFQDRLKLSEWAKGAHNYAYWSPYARAIMLQPRILNTSWRQFSTVFVHEMCHQAVTDVDKVAIVPNDPTQGHGPEWCVWMERVGLPVDRYVRLESTDELLNDKEKVNHARLQAAIGSLRGRSSSKADMFYGRWCMFVDEHYKLQPGVIMGMYKFRRTVVAPAPGHKRGTAVNDPFNGDVAVYTLDQLNRKTDHDFERVPIGMIGLIVPEEHDALLLRLERGAAEAFKRVGHKLTQ